MLKHLTTALCAMIAALFCTVLAGVAHAAPADAELYYVLHSIHTADAPDAPDVDAGSVGFHNVTLSNDAGSGRSLHLQPLWIRNIDAPERDTGTAALDPQVPEDAQVIAVLRAGFLSTIAASGEAGPVRSADAKAFARLKKHDRHRAEQQLQVGQAAGVRPLFLPAGLRVGQQLPVRMIIEPHGPFIADAQVLEVSSQDALLALTMTEPTLRGAGRAAIRLSDGMPIELRMQLDLDARGNAPASRHDVHVATMRNAPHLEMAQDLAMYRDYVGQVRQTLTSVPFNGEQGDPSVYTLSEVPVGALQSHMVALDALPELERSMGFAWVPTGGAGAPALAIGARARLSRGAADEAVLMAHAGPVQALDAAGDVLSGVVAETTLSRIYLGDRFSTAEHERGFPFRLPLGLDAPTRERIHTLRMPVAVEVYRWHSEEIVPVNQASSVNAGVDLKLAAPTRLSVVHARASQQGATGLWTVAVPLDAEGKEIPFRQLPMLPILLKEARTQDALPLAWESRDVPYRVEIAAQAPIHRLQLRHYLWTREPRVWEFRRLQ